jgi:exodeoxyribonuclease VII small subunit
MKKNLTYNEAYEQLEKIVAQIEDEEIQLDKLAEKVKETNELIVFCEKRLREIETEINNIQIKDNNS